MNEASNYIVLSYGTCTIDPSTSGTAWLVTSTYTTHYAHTFQHYSLIYDGYAGTITQDIGLSVWGPNVGFAYRDLFPSTVYAPGSYIDNYTFPAAAPALVLPAGTNLTVNGNSLVATPSDCPSFCTYDVQVQLF